MQTRPNEFGSIGNQFQELLWPLCAINKKSLLVGYFFKIFETCSKGTKMGTKKYKNRKRKVKKSEIQTLWPLWVINKKKSLLVGDDTADLQNGDESTDHLSHFMQ